jgi:U3 small nucleolar RNA-associated protein 10
MKINYVFWMLQISCPTVGWMLDIILDQESLIISSAYGKKKKKLNVHCRSNLPHNVICKGEDALSLLSSVFDILLLKKDIANRSAFLIWISYNYAG